MNASMVYQSAMAAALAAPIESPLDYLERQHGFVTIKTSAGGSARIRNCADRLREFADTVRKNWAAYGGGAKPAELAKPRKPRAIAWPAVTVKVWRELIEAGEFADAFALGSEKLGQLVYSGGRAAFAIVAPLPVDGLPADFASGRRDDGKYVVFDTVSGVAIGARGAASRKAAEESAREMWNDRTEEQHATALRSARNMYNTAPEAARAAWLTEHGIACDAPAAPEPIAEEIQPEPAADDAAPVSDCMAAIIEAASEPEPVADDVAIAHAEVARRLELMAEPEPEPEPIAPDAPDTAPPVPAAPAARDLSLSYAAHVAQSRAIGSRPMSCAQWVRNNTPKPAAPIAPPNPGNPGRAAHPGRCSARRPGVAVRIKPAAPAASRAPGRLAARNIRAAGFRSHRAAIAPHRAGRLAAASRGAVRSIGCAGRPGRGAPPAAGCTILQAPGQAAGGAAGPGPPSGATPRPADSQTPYSRRFPHTGDSP